ncbi:eukaryotic translation initiation factor 4E binding protein-domain-containing protein [Linnemannia elongata]|uniref:Eukaryotic translation initiation factor 4E-binding protein 2 n=1 Tax=Linnemannia schmuckeri TaxID=64567 RepID=A0A9P5V6K0_9FUNG|nr:Eukaryotic translation initiation factor 4E-binding protein 2 [Linnemannia schmuckeri]KAF9296217.1 Eukaryotic translation initiation factor 4E-binding protein 2 [Linnemannia elongata]KAF9911275.1 Eukaryotic translation initiation factor 4E-binding protein 2 [Linnemannia zychae]KAF9340272.1 Eukaryotic translation initiation factor 4E-binding protein 2 [Linnemannia elongata]KAG0061030.1 Eukaryotic translation initiation factor 4E-binding protein 2 [Linnemannia elongata]
MSTNSRAIPLPSRRAEPGTPIPLDYGTTPGGTIYSSTPGGTRIIYDRNTLLSLRNSPLSRTPPAKLAFVAGVTGASLPHQAGSIHNRSHLNVETHDSGSDDDSDEDSDDEKRKAVAKAQEEEDAKAHATASKEIKDGQLFDMDME